MNVFKTEGMPSAVGSSNLGEAPLAATPAELGWGGRSIVHLRGKLSGLVNSIAQLPNAVQLAGDEFYKIPEIKLCNHVY